MRRLLACGLLALAACSEQEPDQDRDALARSDLAAIVTALEGYHGVNGEYPESLAPLVRPDDAGNHFLPGSTPTTYDPWGRPYVYERTPEGYLLVCLGSDGERGGAGAAADIDAAALDAPR